MKKRKIEVGGKVRKVRKKGVGRGISLQLARRNILLKFAYKPFFKMNITNNLCRDTLKKHFINVRI